MQLKSKSVIYKIQKVLSETEFSTVCEAYRKDLSGTIGQKVLLKIFKSQSSTYPLELESLIKVNSPYCISVHHFDIIESKPVLVLEWFHSLNLFQLIRQTSPLTPLETSYICGSVQKGLLDLRSYGICHGDLSGSNVLINSEGMIKLIDFGKGNYMGEEIFSTPVFTAPEVLNGEIPNFYSDLYSLGVLENFLQKPFFNLNEPNLALKDHPLLDPLPQNRKVKEYIFDESARLSLSKKVNQVFEDHLKTRKPISFRRTKKRKSFLPLLFCFGIFSFLGNTQNELPSSSIQIRSHQWMKVSIGDQIGFTPFDSGPLEEGVYLLKWETAQEKGSLKIYLKDKEHLLMRGQKLKAF